MGIKPRKQKRIAKRYNAKELNPKDGYNRFKFFGKVFRYKEAEIFEIEHDFSGMSVPMGRTYAYDEDGKRYVVEFIFKKKWIPFNIGEAHLRYW